ncbi:MAG: imidazolonepropionase [Desulfurococcales archaeon]|nr:imidazolonepropionase [Desulfurococcales archaeon]
MKVDLIIYNIGELVAFDGEGPYSRVKPDSAGIRHNAGIAVRDGVVVDVSSSEDVRWRYEPERVIDAEGLLVTPGLVDIHTHLVFAGSREDEFELKLSGATYSEILERGGGIYRTVRMTKQASNEELIDRALRILDLMARGGTTTVEVKSGYGIDVDEEYRLMRIIREISTRSKQLIIPTLLAHVPPRDQDRRTYVSMFKELIGRVASEGLAVYVDVFCDKGAFTVEESMEIIESGLENGLKARIHADQLEYIGCSKLAGRYPIDSVEHLEKMPGENAEILLQSGSIAGLLPTSIIAMMDPSRPPVRELKRKGVPIAIGSDYNPNNQTPLVQTAMDISTYLLGLTPLEALAAATVNAAYSLGVGDRVGSIRKGYRADIVVWEVENYRWIGYTWGYNKALYTIIGGRHIVPGSKPGLKD